MAILKFLAPVLLLSVCRAQFFNFNSCSKILNEDCFKYGNDPQCGSNGVTYRNRCDFAKAHCEDNNVHISLHSACPTTTAPPNVGSTDNPIASTLAPILHGSEAVLDFFCLNIAFRPCDAVHTPVCGNDTMTYPNPCEFEKARCTHRSLHIVHYGKCSDDPFNP